MRLVLTSHVMHGGMRNLVLHCLAVKLLIWTVVTAAASGCFCRVLIVALILTCFHPLWVRSFHPLLVRSFLPLLVRSFHFFFTPVLVKAAGTCCCFRLSVAPCTTFSLANCSLVCSMLTHVLRVVCWTDQSPRTSLSCSGPLHIFETHEDLSVNTSVLLLSYFGLWVAIPPKLLEQRSILLATAALGVCLVVTGQVSTQTRLY